MHNVRPHSLRMRILVLTLLFTMATALAITVISLYTLTRSIRKNTLRTAEYALQTAAATIRQDIQEIDSLADWCTYNPTLRTYMLSDMSTASLLQTVYPTVSDKYNSMRTNPYLQRFAVGNDNGRRLMFGSNVSMTYYTEAGQLFTLAEQAGDAGWTTIVRDPLMLDSMATEGILVTRVLQSAGWSRNAWVYLSVSPAVITTPLQSGDAPEALLGPLLQKAGQILYNYFSTGVYWSVGRVVPDILQVRQSQQDALAALPLLGQNQTAVFYHDRAHSQLDHRAQLVAQVQQYIQQHLAERLSLNDVAAVFNFSPNYLSQLFAQNSESGFVEFVTATRIAAAKTLMAATELKIYEISDQVGFESAFYFSKVFKKLEGVSPREYMQKVRNE